MRALIRRTRRARRVARAPRRARAGSRRPHGSRSMARPYRVVGHASSESAAGGADGAAGRECSSKSQLEEKIYGWGEEIGSNTVEVYIHSLRKKLGARPDSQRARPRLHGREGRQISIRFAAGCSSEAACARDRRRGVCRVAHLPAGARGSQRTLRLPVAADPGRAAVIRMRFRPCSPSRSGSERRRRDPDWNRSGVLMYYSHPRLPSRRARNSAFPPEMTARGE